MTTAVIFTAGNGKGNTMHVRDIAGGGKGYTLHVCTWLLLMFACYMMLTILKGHGHEIAFSTFLVIFGSAKVH